MSGSAGRNECPAGSSRIETEAVCRAAVAATGKTLGSPFVDSNPDFPRGCYLMTNDAFFNQHVPGGSDSGSRLLCSVVSAVVTAPESVPPPARRTLVDPRTRMRTWVCAALGTGAYSRVCVLCDFVVYCCARAGPPQTPPLTLKGNRTRLAIIQCHVPSACQAGGSCTPGYGDSR